ncbi:prolyl oligopeptidase family serine peptidase [Alteromonas sp. ASW11-19]|uniref:Prolyl oligopeptidase family serine peptidase n=1 Tax=Alteromonas salexigens TaxID=2982530 RepID=A0ABT2VKA3_9ALTE|nr:prolyl oligopeptidase family serine peptidase [Alteromonas salexigens]MCU7553705.1 prolyl oligopeptidase family serine peptidase [Alteromonas salexigens]
MKQGLLTAVLLVLINFPVIADSETYEPPPAAFRSPELTYTGAAIPFSSYAEWLTAVKQQSKPLLRAERWQRSIDPRDFDRLKAATDAHWLTYQSDGLTIAGVIAYPTAPVSEKLPVVIYNRGGNSRHNVTRTRLYNMLLPIAEQGYIVLASNYRGSKYSEGTDEFGGNDVNDVLRLIDIAKTLPGADGSKIALMGVSRGSMMNWLTLRKRPENISAAIMIAGSVNAFNSTQRRPEMKKLMASMIPGFADNQKAELERRSSIYWMDELDRNVPILLLHGTDDLRVSYDNATLAAERLSALSHPHKLVTFSHGDHSLSFYRTQMLTEVIAWLDRYLQDT